MIIKPALYLFDPDQTYDLLAFESIENTIRVLLDNALSLHCPLTVDEFYTPPNLLFERYTVWDLPWCEDYSTLYYEFVKKISRCSAKEIGLSREYYNSFIDPSPYSFPSSVGDFDAIPNTIQIRIPANTEASVTYLTLAHDTLSVGVLNGQEVTIFNKKKIEFVSTLEERIVEIKISLALHNSFVFTDCNPQVSGTLLNILVYEKLQETLDLIYSRLNLPTFKVLTAIDVTLDVSYFPRLTRFPNSPIYEISRPEGQLDNISINNPVYTDLPSDYYVASLIYANNNKWGNDDPVRADLGKNIAITVNQDNSIGLNVWNMGEAVGYGFNNYDANNWVNLTFSNVYDIPTISVNVVVPLLKFGRTVSIRTGTFGSPEILYISPFNPLDLTKAIVVYTYGQDVVDNIFLGDFIPVGYIPGNSIYKSPRFDTGELNESSAYGANVLCYQFEAENDRLFSESQNIYLYANGYSTVYSVPTPNPFDLNVTFRTVSTRAYYITNVLKVYDANRHRDFNNFSVYTNLGYAIEQENINVPVGTIDTDSNTTLDPVTVTLRRTLNTTGYKGIDFPYRRIPSGVTLLNQRIALDNWVNIVDNLNVEYNFNNASGAYNANNLDFIVVIDDSTINLPNINNATLKLVLRYKTDGSIPSISFNKNVFMDNVNFNLIYVEYDLFSNNSGDWALINNRGVMPDSIRIKEIHAALQADKFSVDEINPQLPRVANIGYYVERIARVLGISVNSDGSIRSVRQRATVVPSANGNATIPAGWGRGQWQANTGGMSAGQEGGLNTENRDGIVYANRCNRNVKSQFNDATFDLEPPTYVLCENIMQYIESYLEDLDQGLNWQEMGAMALPSPFPDDEGNNKYCTYEGMGTLLAEVAYMLSAMSKDTSQTFIASLANQAIAKVILQSVGTPLYLARHELESDDGETGYSGSIPVPVIADDAPTLVSLLFNILENQARILGKEAKLDKKYR